MNVAQVIKRLKMAKKPDIQRELILDAWENCDTFFVGLQMSCDKDTVIPLEKVPEIPQDDGAESDFTFNDFLRLYDEITQVGMDPAKARELVIDAAMIADVAEWNTFYRRILLRKLQDDVPMELIVEVLQELTGFEFQL